MALYQRAARKVQIFLSLYNKEGNWAAIWCFHTSRKKRKKKKKIGAEGAVGRRRRRREAAPPRRRRRGSAGGAGNNDAVIKTSLWPRVHVFAELGRVRLAHRERARLSSTRPAATRAVPLWAAGSPARAPRAGSVGLGEGDFAEASRSEPTTKRKISPAPPRSARPGMGVHWH